MKPIADPRYCEDSAPPQISRFLLQHVATLGRRQTAVSWGGMAMLASPTLGEALDLAIDRIELEYPRPPHWQRYAEIFRCPVKFGAGHSLIAFDAHWLQLPLPTRDDYVAAEIASRLDSAGWAQQGSSDLIETIQREVRKHLCRPPQLAELAQQLNLGERTLCRRIDEAGLSYHGIIDSLRRAKALALLSHRDSRLIDVANETGFSDVRNFRRAFKRWTGVAPQKPAGRSTPPDTPQT